VYLQRDASVAHRVQELATDFASLGNVKEQLGKLISYGASLARMKSEDKVLANQVIGCAAQVWMVVTLDADGAVSITADSDSEISRGLACILIRAFDGLTPAEIDSADVSVLEQLRLGPVLDSPSRTNSFRNMFNTLKKRANMLVGELPRFPSLVIRRDSLQPLGSFAESQAQYLQPDGATVARIASVLQEKKIGVVAHFYMDPQVQGVLSSAAESWPHIHISGAPPANAGCP
jgi:quinolinate synthase